MTIELAGHPPLEVAYWISQIVSAIAQLLLVAVAIWAGIAAYGQANAFRLFELLKYTQDEKFRESRRFVIREIGPIKQREWWKDPNFECMASDCCAHYDILGRMLIFSRTGGVGKFFVTHWADSIVRTHEILEKFIEQRRLSGGNDYKGYEWLYIEAKKRRPHIGPSWPPNEDAKKP